MGENSRLHRIINQRKFRDLVTTHHTSFDKNYDTNLKARHVSCEDSPHSSFIVESLRYSIDKQVKESFYSNVIICYRKETIVS